MNFPVVKIDADARIKNFLIHHAYSQIENPKRLIVLMPAALLSTRINRTQVVFSRWTWRDAWPLDNVLAFADPAVQASPELDAAWYISREHDIIQYIAQIIKEKADQANISHDNIIIYGSSLGGFGAFCAATFIPGSRVIAEVPQINMLNWMPAVLEKIEKHITHEPLTEFAKQFPERVDVKERIIKNNHLPEFILITNMQDQFSEQLQFHNWAKEFDPKKRVELITTTIVKGHTPLSKDDLLRFF